MEVKKNNCCCCGQVFIPNKRQGDRQKTCGRNICQKKLNRANQLKWLQKNPDYFAGRYENTKAWRKKNPNYQKQWRKNVNEIQNSILEQGILDPLYVINSADSNHIILDGFERYRCAARLSLPEVPVISLDSSEAMGILKLLRLSASKCLSSLEEAGLVDELYQRHGMRTILKKSTIGVITR